MKIEEKELRIGNILTNKVGSSEGDYYGAVTVEEITKCGFICLDEWDVLQTSNDVEYLGLPLTEEWWDKFGYECIQEFVTHLIEKSIFPIEDDVAHWVEVLKDEPVHFIQNQFYYFTKQELTIKK